MEDKTVTRETLYKLVWSKPMLKIAEDFGLSSSYLARVCKSMNVPRPPRGHWAKLEAGKASPQPPLPTAAPSDLLVWSPGMSIDLGYRNTRHNQIGRQSPSNQAKVQSHHRLLNNVKPLFLKGRERDNGLLYPNKRLLVDILVSKNALDTLLKFTDQLFVQLESNGYLIDFAPNHLRLQRKAYDVCKSPEKTGYSQSLWGPSRPTVVFVGKVPIGISLFEQTDNVEVLYVDGTYIPMSEIDDIAMKKYSRKHTWQTTKEKVTGKFYLRLYSPHQGTDWAKLFPIDPTSCYDLARKLIEGIQNMVRAISKQIKDAEIAAEQRRLEWEQEKARLRIQERERRAKSAMDTSHAQLVSAIEEWRRIKAIEMFFDEVEKDIATMPITDQAALKLRLCVFC